MRNLATRKVLSSVAILLWVALANTAYAACATGGPAGGPPTVCVWPAVPIGDVIANTAVDVSMPAHAAQGLAASTVGVLIPATAGAFSVTVTQGSAVGDRVFTNETPVTGTAGTTGSLLPKWQILDVIYAAPGNKSQTGMLLSCFNYGTSFLFGTTNSNSQSFAQTTTYEVKGGVFASGSGSLSFSNEQGTSDSEQIQATDSSGLQTCGSQTEDGIDPYHADDQIVVMINPAVNLSLFPISTAYPKGLVETTGLATNTADTNTDGQPDIIYFYVGDLQQLATGVAPSSLPDLVGYATRLMRSWDPATGALNTADYAEILKADPFAANPTLNPSTSSQFDPVIPSGSTTQLQIDYTPDSMQMAPNCQNYMAGYTNTTTKGQAASQTYTVSTSADLSAILAGLMETDTYKSTNMASSKTTSATSQAAMLHVCTPAYADNYSGPFTLYAYKDNIYGTFVLSPDAAPAP